MSAATPGQAGPLHFTYDGCMALTCFADDPEADLGQLVAFIDPGDSLDYLTGKIREHQAEHRCAPSQEAQAAPELDGLRKALHAISLGIAEPSPKSVAEDALNGRYFDPMTDSGVWRTSDLGTAWRLLDEARAGLRELTGRMTALAGEWVADAEHDETRVRPTVISDARARTLRECADELRKRATEVTDGTHA